MTDDLPAGSSALDREAYDWVMRFARGRAGPADLAGLAQWAARSPAHKAAFDRVSRAWTALGSAGPTLSYGSAAASPRVGPAAAVPLRARIGRRAVLGGVLAASAAGAAVVVAQPPLGLWPSWTELAADYRTRPGERRQIVAAEQVSIDMNTRTSIAVRAAGTEAELVTGEAMIAVGGRNGVPFWLHAADGRIVAADAHFNVRVDGPAVCVTCLAGEVQIVRQTTPLPLPAGHQVLYSDQGIGRVEAINLAIVTAWRDGIVIFQSTPVREVVAEVNRYRAGRIILTNQSLGERLFNARLRIENIGRVVNLIEQTFGARATPLPGGVVLLG